MHGRFQYAVLGAMMTLLALLGAFAVLSSSTRADSSVTAAPTTDAGNASAGAPFEATETTVHPPVVSSGPVDDAVAGDKQAPVVAADSSDSASVVQAGSDNDPETDIDAILARLTEFADMEDEALLGRAGWLHLKSAMAIPEERRGNGYHLGETDEVLPMEALAPDVQVFETWYHVDGTGTYDQGMGLVTSGEGAVHQQTILSGQKWINLTLKTAGAYRQQYESSADMALPLLPAALAVSAVEERQEWKNTSIRAYSEEGHFIVDIEQWYDPPIDNDISITEPILKSRETFTFEEATGHLLSREVQLLPLNGTWLTIEKEEYLEAELKSELPEGVSRLFDNAIELLEKE